MLLTAPQPFSFRELEIQREEFVVAAESLISPSVKKLIAEVERFAPPIPTAPERITVTVEGSNHADPQYDTE